MLRRVAGPRGWAAALGMLAGLMALVRPAAALNQRLYPLQELIKESECIAVGRAVAVDVPRMRAALVLEESLKGRAPYKWLAVNIAPGGWGHPPFLMRRLGPGVRLVYFTAHVKGRHVVLAYQNGTWFQISAPEGQAPDQLAWTFTHCEVFLRRTFAGSTDELIRILREVQSGKREAPAPNLANGQGFGPELSVNAKADSTLPALPAFIARAIAAPRSGGVVRKVQVRKLDAEERGWVAAAARQFQRPPEDAAALLALAHYDRKDAQRALEYERDYGCGGNRAWVRSAEEILALKQRSDRLCWLDVRGVLMRAGELFTPVTDPVDLILNLRTRFSWDELDPMLDDDKWGRHKLSEVAEKKLAARMTRPLGGDRIGRVLVTSTFGTPGSGDQSTEAFGWKPLPGQPWDLARRQFDWGGEDVGTQRPGAVQFNAPGSRANPLANQPPPPGVPLAGGAGSYSGTSLWLAGGLGDYNGSSRGAPGAYAFYDQEWVRVRQGDSRSFLVTAQVYTPDHTDELGEPRSGWFYINRTSRYIDAGIRITDAQTRTRNFGPEQALLLRVEPACGKFDRVLLRVDVSTHRELGKKNSDGKNRVQLTAFADGIGEVARRTLDLNQSASQLDANDDGIAFTPTYGLRRPMDGYVPECYVAAVRVQQLNVGEVDLLHPGETPAAPKPVQPLASVLPGTTPPVGATAPRPPVTRSAPLSAVPAARAAASQPAAVAAPRPIPRVAAAPKPAVSSSAAARILQSPRSLVIAIDTSGSIGPLLEKARSAALELLASLQPGDRFALLDCAAVVKPFAADWTPVSPESLKRATAWVGRLKPSHGTDLQALLRHAFAYTGVNHLVLVTDGGLPSRGILDLDRLYKLAKELNLTSARVDAMLLAPAAEDNPASHLARDHGGSTQLR